jgi:hypothetical protein
LDGKQPEAAFTNLKTRGYLIYPNHNFFKLISAIEEGYVKHSTASDVFNKAIDYVLEEHGDLLTFPCSDHKTEIMTNIFQYHIIMRMKQFTMSQNKQLKKKSYKKKNYQNLLLHNRYLINYFHYIIY